MEEKNILLTLSLTTFESAEKNVSDICEMGKKVMKPIMHKSALLNQKIVKNTLPLCILSQFLLPLFSMLVQVQPI